MAHTLPLQLSVATSEPAADCPKVMNVSASCRSTCDSTYVSPARSALIATSSQAGRIVAHALSAYRVQVESEIALVVSAAAPRDGASAGGGVARERVMQVEQVESTLAWTRAGVVDQNVIGCRSHAVTANVSALSYFCRPWVVPVLYGNRLQLLLGNTVTHAAEDSLERGERVDRAEESSRGAGVLAVHPLADDRDAYYRFTGGDTVAGLHPAGRDIPIVRVRVEPQRAPRGRTLLFRGTPDRDAVRHQIVRMHGQFRLPGPRSSLLDRIISGGSESVAFAELEMGEFDGAYWLPTAQRLEGQGRSSLAAEFRPIVRVVSRFRDYKVNPTARWAGILTAERMLRVRRLCGAVVLACVSPLRVSAQGVSAVLARGADIAQMTGARTDAVSRRALVADTSLATHRKDRRLLTPHDLGLTAVFAVATVAALPLDRALAGAAQASVLQHSAPLRQTATLFRVLGDPGTLVVTVGTYGVGRVLHTPGVADAGLHATEAVIVSGAVTAALKLVVGRARPYVVGDSDAFDFRAGRGTGGFTAFPSGHTSAAFAVASAFSAEFSHSRYALRHTTTARMVSPVLYGAATLVGLSRMYNDKHWASDVMAGAAIGTVSGLALVRFKHAAPPGRMERWLIPNALSPSPGGASIRWSAAF